ncbi:MAG: outer membrane lipid asymmetry maintenance protein MlaD [Gallionellaceae bacterium]|jgi:phospholipid/cholesterol/gamma-HCH transport system substrate-binding protein
MSRNTLDLWVGVFVVAGMFAIAILAFKVANLSSYNSSETYVLKANFTNIGGLKPKASVRSSGVLVGRVTAIQLDTERYEAQITMSIDKQFQFPKDSLVSVLTSGLLGEQYVGLKPGADEEMLKENATIRQTRSAVVLEELIGQVIASKAEGVSK